MVEIAATDKELSAGILDGEVRQFTASDAGSRKQGAGQHGIVFIQPLQGDGVAQVQRGSALDSARALALKRFHDSCAGAFCNREGCDGHVLIHRDSVAASPDIGIIQRDVEFAFPVGGYFSVDFSGTIECQIRDNGGIV